MARPKSERPEPVEWPEIASGQSERLRVLRERRGWSLRDLAAASGVSVRSIRTIEDGGRGAVRSDILAALADALDVPRGWLAYGDTVIWPKASPSF